MMLSRHGCAQAFLDRRRDVDCVDESDLESERLEQARNLVSSSRSYEFSLDSVDAKVLLHLVVDVFQRSRHLSQI